MTEKCTNTIIIVTTDSHAEIARRLAHDISKKPEHEATYWSIKHYKDNEASLGNKNYLIFIGDKDENIFTKVYMPLINNITIKNHACIGYNGTKAVIFSDNLECFWRDVPSRIKREYDRWCREIGTPLATIAMIGQPLSIVTYGIWGYRYSVELYKHKQITESAATIFITEYFDKWINSNKLQDA